MSQRFIRCSHCGLPHDVLQVVCPATGKPMERTRHHASQGAMPAVEKVPILPGRPPAAPSRPPPPPPALSTLPPGRSASRDLTGKKIGGKYLVRSVLGEGGMGTVFEAENVTIGRAVAVKVLHPNQARKKDAVRRFHQEARAAGAIGHPNICEVYDLGTLDDGSPYLVMEKLVGETLADRIASEGGLPFDDVIDVLTQVLSGLVAAHEKRIVHRDIKPENVFLTKRVGCPPVAKLLDFGVSKMIAPLLAGDRDEDLDLTRTGMVMGTPYYMSPEQARGDRNLDARVDLYACGVIMYEALTGRRPFTAANYNALLLQILTTKPRPAREHRPALPQGFDQVLDKSMARAREDRYQNAAEFQRDLQQLRDRHNQHGASAALSPSTKKAFNVAEVAKQAFGVTKAPAPSSSLIARPKSSPAHTPPAIDTRPPPRPRLAQPPPAIPRPPASASFGPLPPRQKELTPSSVEIPIVFGAAETPLSGENMPVEPTDVVSHRAAAPSSSDHGFDDLPTEVRASPMARTMEEEHTTQKRGPELGPLLAKVVINEEGGDTEIIGASPPPRRAASSSGDSDQDPTVALVRPGFPKRRGGRKPVPSSPDDTIKMSEDLAERLLEARERIDGDAPASSATGPKQRR
jgi:serine/threonine-protein kinase